MAEKGTLYLVSIPIGNYDDITLRALKILKEVPVIICEEYKEANRLLSRYEIKKELVALNEHNEKEVANDILMMLIEGKDLALISDCGTPLFSDPGKLLVEICIANRINIVPVPGASSILPALITSGFSLDSFYYAGWLSPKKDVRLQELFKLKPIKEVIVLMDTPYRLKPVLADIKKVFGKFIQISLAYNITMEKERYFRGTVDEILKIAEERNLKGEFVIILNNRK